MVIRLDIVKNLQGPKMYLCAPSSWSCKRSKWTRKQTHIQIVYYSKMLHILIRLLHGQHFLALTVCITKI